MAIDARGEQIVAGAPQLLADRGTGPGKAFRFRFSNGTWQPGEPLGTDALAGEGFGFAVAILDTGLVAVGAPGAQSNAGKIRVFPNDSSDPRTLAACESTAGGEFGYSLATDGTSLLASARRTGARDGAAYLFRCSTRSCETSLLKLKAGRSGAEFGRSVAILRDLALAGAPLDQNDAGAAVAFDLGGVVVAKPKLIGIGGRFVPGKDLTLTFEVTNRSAERLDLPIDLRFPPDLRRPNLCRQIVGGAEQCGLPIREPGHAIDTLPVQGLGIATYKVTGTIPPGLRGEVEASLAAGIPGGVFEPTPEGLAQSDRGTLEPIANLRLDLGAPSRAVPGATQRLEFTLQVKNEGPSSILGTKLVARIPNASEIKEINCRDCRSCLTNSSTILCTLDPRADLAPTDAMDFVISGKVLPGALRPVRLEVSSEPRRGEPGAKKASRVVTLDPTAKIEVEVDTLPGNANLPTLVPGQPSDKVLYKVTIKHTEGPSLFRGARVEAVPDSEISRACHLTGGRPTGSPLIVNVGNLALHNQVDLLLDCGSLPANAANVRGAIPAPNFRLTDIRPAASPNISAPGVTSGKIITLTPEAGLTLTLDPSVPSLPVVPGKASLYKLTLSNSGPSDSPRTRVFPCIGEVEGCPKVALDCHGIECISDPAGSNHSTVCVLPLPAGSSRNCDATVTFAPSARGNLQVTARARSGWPSSETGPTQRIASPVSPTPQADLKVEIRDPEEFPIDPTVPTDSQIPGVRFKVNVSNAGPSDALDVDTTLFLPALLPAAGLTCDLDNQCSTQPDGNILWTRNVNAEPDSTTRTGRTLIAIGPLASNPLLRGPLVLRASTTSADAFPTGGRDSGFTVVHVSAGVEEVASAALVVEGEFKPGGQVRYTAFLDNNTDAPIADDPVTHEFSVTLPEDLTPEVSTPGCELGFGLMIDPNNPQTLYWDGAIEDQLATVTFCAKIADVPTMTAIGVRGITRLGGETGKTDTHCPYSADNISDTVFHVVGGTPVGGQPDRCGAFSADPDPLLR
ncbi:MAG TPA: hypothetical protein VGS22_13185 [Thermoanaerobaculia bacterium]|nr:hypothetical protein [Thermoanaerobaculia bacterium]